MCFSVFPIHSWRTGFSGKVTEHNPPGKGCANRAFLVEKIPRRIPPLSHATQELSVTSSWDMARGNKSDYLLVASWWGKNRGKSSGRGCHRSSGAFPGLEVSCWMQDPSIPPSQEGCSSRCLWDNSIEYNDKCTQGRDKREQVYLHPIGSTQAPQQSIFHSIHTEFPPNNVGICLFGVSLFVFNYFILFYKSVISSCRIQTVQQKCSHWCPFHKGPKGTGHIAVPILIFILLLSNGN